MTALITKSGRILMARHLLGLETSGITHCALGSGDTSFVNPESPPAPSVNQIALIHETARKRFSRRSYLETATDGPIYLDGKRYREATAGTETSILGVFFQFSPEEASGFTIKEYGFFGGGVAYMPEVGGDLALDGVHSALANPDGQVQDPGMLFQISTIPDFYKMADTQLELVCVCHI